MGYVYILKLGLTDNNSKPLYKIGRTNHLKDRIKSLKCTFPKSKLVASIHFQSDYDRHAEKCIHKNWAGHRVRLITESFRLNENEIYEIIRQLKTHQNIDKGFK